MNDFLHLWAADTPEPSAVPPARVMPEPPGWVDATRSRLFQLTTLAFDPSDFDLCVDMIRLLDMAEADDVPAPAVKPASRRRPGCMWEVGRHSVVVIMGPAGADVRAYSGSAPVLSIFYASGSDGEPRDGEEKRAVVRLRMALLWLYNRRSCDGECCGK